MTTLIKNCGLKTAEAIAQAVATGASFIGFVNFKKSPRHLKLEQGAELRKLVPASVKLVAVLVNSRDDLLQSIVEQWKPDLIQVHDVRDTNRLRAIKQRTKLPLILGWPVTSAEDIRATDEFVDIVDYLLLDAKKDGEHGGTGESFDWSILATEKPKLPWFLAGGLTPENVAEAIAITKAPAVDVSSGLESAPGTKSLEKIAAFNQAVLHGANE